MHMADQLPERGSREWRVQQPAIQRKLDDCLTWMAEREFSDSKDIERAAEQLWGVYSNQDFRHHCSNFVDIIEFDAQVPSGQDVATKERLESFNVSIETSQARAACLTANLRQILTYDPDTSSGIENDVYIRKLQRLDSFEKLYDHVSLEGKRAGYEWRRARTLLDELNKAEEAVHDARVRADKATKKVAKANENAESLQREMIAILGVFSAITLAFNASVSFTTSSVSVANSAATNIYQIAFVVTVVGIFLFNMLYACFSFVSRIVEGKKDSSSKHEPFISTEKLIGIEIIGVLLAIIFGFLAS